MPWTMRSIAAEDIAVNSNNSSTHVWMVGGANTEQGFGIYSWNGTSWTEDTGKKGLRIAVASDGIVYVVDREGKIWKRASANTWSRVANSENELIRAVDLAVKDMGTELYIVSAESAGDGLGNKVYRWNTTTSIWVEISGLSAIRLAITSDSTPTFWTVNLRKEIYSGTVSNNTWTGNVDPQASGIDIAVGTSPWVLGMSPTSPNGNMVYTRDTTGSWSTQNAFAAALAATKTATAQKVWIVNAQGSVQELT